MCRLLGISANKPVDLRFSLFEGRRTLQGLGEENPDGWGLGWYDEDGRPFVKKEARRPSKSKLFRPTALEARSRVFVAHVRKATDGRARKKNCHPFCFDRWLFAHNGSVDRDKLQAHLKAPYAEALEGETDSEVYFRWILQCIESKGDAKEGIAAAINVVRLHARTGLNFLLTDGSTLYAYRDCRDGCGGYTLFYLVRASRDGGPMSVRSREVEALVESKALKGERAVLVCSEGLTEEPWTEIPLRHLLVVGPDLAPSWVEVA